MEENVENSPLIQNSVVLSDKEIEKMIRAEKLKIEPFLRLSCKIEAL